MHILQNLADRVFLFAVRHAAILVERYCANQSKDGPFHKPLPSGHHPLRHTDEAACCLSVVDWHLHMELVCGSPSMLRPHRSPARQGGLPVAVPYPLRILHASLPTLGRLWRPRFHRPVLLGLRHANNRPFRPEGNSVDDFRMMIANGVLDDPLHQHGLRHRLRHRVSMCGLQVADG
jgi:hypothetical protein